MRENKQWLVGQRYQNSHYTNVCKRKNCWWCCHDQHDYIVKINKSTYKEYINSILETVPTFLCSKTINTLRGNHSLRMQFQEIRDHLQTLLFSHVFKYPQQNPHYGNSENRKLRDVAFIKRFQKFKGKFGQINN